MTPQEPQPQMSAMLSDLRTAGWSVAVHNDYQQNGEAHTFWLMTKGNLAAKGEGRNDAEALARLSAAVMEIEPPTGKPAPYLTVSIDYALNWCPQCHRGVHTNDEGKCDECGQWTQAPFDEEDARLSGQEMSSLGLPYYQRNPGGPDLLLWWWNPQRRLLSGQATTSDLAAVLKALPAKTKVSVIRLLLDIDPDAQRTLLFSNREQMHDWHSRTREAEAALELVKKENEKLHEELQQIDDIIQEVGFEQGNAVRDVKQMAINLDAERVRLDGARDALLKIEAETYAEDGLSYRRLHSMACQGLLASSTEAPEPKDPAEASSLAVGPADDDPGLQGHAAVASAIVNEARFDPKLFEYVVNHIIASRQEAFKSLYPRQWAYGLLLALEERFGFNCSNQRPP